MKRYINDKGEFYNGQSILTADVVVENPTEQDLVAAGYVLIWEKDGSEYDGSPIEIDGEVIENPTDEQLIEAGYSQVWIYYLTREQYNGGSVTIKGHYISNPTEEQLIENGYHEYIPPTPPAPTPEELLQQAKDRRIADIEEYDNSTNVDSFTINGQVMWLTVEEREQIATQISAHEAVGRTEMTRWFGGMPFTFTLVAWRQMLVALEVYCGDALNVTESHKATVNAMTTVEEVEAYDITLGYPKRLEFNQNGEGL